MSTSTTSLLEVAEAIAPTWERRRAFIEQVTTPVRDWLIRELRAGEGDTVLELAAGAGDTGFEAARIVGDRGRLICSDFSPAMLEVARRRGAELGVRNADYRVIDAERIDLEASSVDGVLCRFAYMLMTDPAAALAETRRVMRPGGRLALAVWGTPERNPFFSAIGAALTARGHLPPPDPDAPGPFRLANPERLGALLERAGFAHVRIEEVAGAFEVADAGEYLDIVADTAGPIALALRGVPAAERAGLRAAVEQAFTPFATGAGYRVPGAALCASAD